MSRVRSAILNWVKPNEDRIIGPTSGSLKSPTRVWARSLGDAPPIAFEVWEHRFAARVVRALGLKKPAEHLPVAHRLSGFALSEAWQASSPRMPGQGTYYFEDGQGNRSGRITVTTANAAITTKGVKAGGHLVTIGPDGFSVSLPVDAGRQVEISHTLSAPAEDPDVLVGLLLPGEEGEHDLQRQVLDYLISLDLPDLPDSLRGPGAYGVLDDLSAGFLPRERPPWDFSLGGNESWAEREFAVEPGEPQEVVVSVAAPPANSRVSYALSVSEAAEPTSRVLSSVIEIESLESGEVRISDGTAETDLPIDLAQFLIRCLAELEVDDPAVAMWIGVYDGDADRVRIALEQGADPNERDSQVIVRHAAILRRYLPLEMASWERFQSIG